MSIHYVKRERLFLIAVNRERNNSWSVNKNDPVIREMNSLFLEIRDHGQYI